MSESRPDESGRHNFSNGPIIETAVEVAKIAVPLVGVVVSHKLTERREERSRPRQANEKTE